MKKIRETLVFPVCFAFVLGGLNTLSSGLGYARTQTLLISLLGFIGILTLTNPMLRRHGFNNKAASLVFAIMVAFIWFFISYRETMPDVMNMSAYGKWGPLLGYISRRPDQLVVECLLTSVIFLSLAGVLWSGYGLMRDRSEHLTRQ